MRAGVAEVELGHPAARGIERIGGGARPGHEIVAVMSGVANPLLPAAALDTPVTYDDLRAAGGGLGAAGFIVFDDTDRPGRGRRRRGPLPRGRVVRAVPPLQGRRPRARRPPGQARPHRTPPSATSTRSAGASTLVAEGARCNLATQQQVVVGSVLQQFPAVVGAHAEGDGNGARAGVHRRARRHRRRPRGDARSRNARSSPTGPTTRSTPASGPPTASTTPASRSTPTDPIRPGRPRNRSNRCPNPLPRTRPTPACRRRSPTSATSRVPALLGNDARARLHADGFDDEQIDAWAETFIAEVRLGHGRRVRGLDRPPGVAGLTPRPAPRPDPVAALGTTGSGQGGSGCG